MEDRRKAMEEFDKAWRYRLEERRQAYIRKREAEIARIMKARKERK